MARDLVIKIVGDSSSFERALRKSSTDATRFSSQMSSRLKTAGIAAGATLAAGLVAGLKSSVDAAIDAQKVLSQTQVAVKNAGQSWDAYSGQINQSTQALSKLSALNDERLLQSFSRLVLVTHNVSSALKLNALAADIARARDMDVVDAAQLLAKVQAGNIGILRRLGIQIDKNATSQQALARLQQLYGGAAAAYGKTAAGAQERFNVALENMQEAIGTALLPTVTNYLNKASEWLNDSKNQKKVTDDLTASVNLLAGAAELAAKGFGDLNDAANKLHLPGFLGKIGQLAKAGVTGPMTRAYQPLYDLLTGGGGGGGAGFDEIIAGLKNWQKTLAGPAVPAPAGISGAGTAGQSQQELGRLATQRAARRNTWFDQMISRMLGGVQDIPGLRAQIARLKVIAGLVQQRIAATKDITRRLTLEGTLAGVMRQIRDDQQQQADAAKQAHQDAVQNKLDWLQLAIDKTEITKGVGDNIAATDRYIAAIKTLIRTEGDSLTYEQALLQARQSRQALVEQASEQAKTARENRQFAALGLGPGGAALVPNAAQLRQRLGRLEDAVAGTFLDTTKTGRLFDRIQRVLSGRFGTLTESVRSEIKQMLDTVSQQFDQKPAGGKKPRHNLFTALGLTPEGLPVTTIYGRADYERLRRAWNPSMGALRFAHGSGLDFAAPRSVTINGGVHVHGVDNPRQFLNELEKMQRGKPHTRRGAG